MKFAFGVMAAVVISASTRVHGYVLEGQSWPQDSVVVFQLSLGDPGHTLLDGNTSWNAAAAPISGMWSGVVQHLSITNVMDSTVPVAHGDHQNSIAFANNVFGQPFGGNTLAVTYYSYSGSTILESDTLVNRAQNFDSYRGPLRFPAGGGYAIADIRRVLLHEMGHAIGLGHPDSAGQHVVAIMNSTISDQEVLSSDDIAGAQAIYGARVDSTPAPTPGPGVPGHLANISTRLKVGVGQGVLIGGFIVEGSQSKKVILRAIGPSLSGSVSNALADPVLELHGSSGVIASNDDWQSSPQAADILSSGLAPSDPNESAILVTLSPGSYTAVVSGYQGGQGVGLVEAYELDSNTTRLLNISTRGNVGVSNDAMIGGLIVAGVNAKSIIVRAVGPSLPFSGTLTDPVLELRDGSGNLIVSNDNWVSSPQHDEIVASGVAPTDNRESAVVATFGAGSYTAVVRGVNDTTGVALLEVYDLDQ